MAGARAGGVAVFIGAAVRLAKPHMTARPRSTAAIAATASLLAWWSPLNAFVILMLAGLAGARLLTPP